MADKEIAIKVTSIGKTFQPQSSSGTIKEAFITIGRKITRKNKSIHHQGEYTALKDISFEVQKGDFFGIVGRNGCGKSTLLKILAGVYTPTKGHVQVNGKLTPFIELGVGFNPELSGRDNVFLNGALLGFTHNQMEEMYDDIVNFAELHEFMETKLKNYSSGMQVRLAFSVAIRAESDVLLIDEVLAVGDAAFQQKCFDYFETLKENKKTVILVTHDMDAVKRFCNKALLIDDHIVKVMGSPIKVADRYMIDNFISQPVDRQKEEADKKDALKNRNHLNLKFDYKNVHNEQTSKYNCGDTIKVHLSYDVNDSYKYLVLNIYKQTGEHITGFRIDASETGQSTVEVRALISKGRYYFLVQAVNESALAVGDEILGPEFKIVTDKAPGVPGWTGLVPMQYTEIK